MVHQGKERVGRGAASTEVSRAQETLEAARHRRDARAMPKDEEDYFKEVSGIITHTDPFSDASSM